MQITVTFDSWEELEAFRNPIIKKHPDDTFVLEKGAGPAVPTSITMTAEETADPKDLAVTMNADTAEAIAAPAEPDYELLRLDVRKVLADLNKAQSGKPAQKLIKEMGFNGLSDVPGERLQELMDKAKEMM